MDDPLLMRVLHALTHRQEQLEPGARVEPMVVRVTRD